MVLVELESINRILSKWQLVSSMWDLEQEGVTEVIMRHHSISMAAQTTFTQVDHLEDMKRPLRKL